MNKALLEQFHGDMLNIYQRAKVEANYPANRFLHMVGEHGGFETARVLIHSDKVSDGYTALWERQRLDLTVEAMILSNPKYHELFTDEELAICRKRLLEYGYDKLTDNS